MQAKVIKQRAVPPIEPIRLSSWHRWSIYVSTGLLAASGLVWLLAHYFLRRHGEFGDIPSPAEAWMLRLHGLSMLAALFLCGSLLKTHMLKAWQIRRNRWTGLLAVSLLLVLAVTGYLLYYFSNEDLRPILSVVHWVPGIALTFSLPMHVWKGRRRTEAAQAYLKRAA